MMTDKKRTYGQFETPPEVADLLLAFCMRQPSDRLLDPSCGTGAFLSRAALMQQWLDPDVGSPDTLWGVELDPEAVVLAQKTLPDSHIIQSNFFELDPWPDLFDVIIGNPPYTRAEWFGRLPETPDLVRQLSIFNGMKGAQKPTGHLDRHVGLSRRAGLHAYFFVHGTDFLREGGRFGFVVPNSWLDVAYGERLKQFLLDHYRILALIESNVERWFGEAKVNTCLVILERCSDATARATNQVRLVRLRQSLRELIPANDDDAQRVALLKELIPQLLPDRDIKSERFVVRITCQRALAAAEKWGVAIRAPAVYRHHSEDARLVPLGSWAMIHRGYTTGANAYFYLDNDTIEDWGIEEHLRRPLLKSLRKVNKRIVTAAACEHQALWIPPMSDLSGTAAARYISWGEKQNLHRRRTCANRQPWYRLPEQDEAQILIPKGIWERHFVPLLKDDVLVDQQLYRVRFSRRIDPMVVAALLNSAWFALLVELHGRVNFGEGVLWLATYELEDLRLPDPRYLPAEQAAQLVEAYKPFMDQPVGTVQEAVTEPSWHAYNGVVFEILGFSAAEAGTVTEALLERVATRCMKAGKKPAIVHNQEY
jgi:methylase of polypeptide subunit release factors